MKSAAELEQGLDDFSSVLANDRGALEPTDDWYVANLHGEGAEDVIASLARAIRRTQGSQLYYFSGQRGTGKSTELRRLAVTLNAEPKTRAYVVDVLDYISDSHPIETIDLLLITALAFADRLKDIGTFGEDFLKDDGVFSRFGKWLQTDVEITGVNIGGIKTDFKKQQQSVVKRIREFDLARQEKVMAECREFVRDMAQAVRDRWQADKVVLMIDSLERLRGIGDAAAEMFDRVVKVFDGDSDQLRLPEMQVIYSVPPYLPYLSNIKQRVQLYMLASVRVCEPPAKARRQPRVAGLGAMERVVSKRFAAWPSLISRPALQCLMLASGGDLRQLLRRLLLEVLDQAYYALDRLPLAANDAIIATVLETQRVDFEGLVVQEEYPLLKSIGEKNSLDLPRRVDLPVAARFFDVRAVLNYRNGVEWLDLNPLLWPLIDGWQPPLAPVLPGALTTALTNDTDPVV